MNCEQVRELLSAYLDDALAPEEKRTLATHLETCSECRAMLADFRHFDTLLHHLPRVSPGVGLRQKIFSSPEYLELTGASVSGKKPSVQTAPYRSVRKGIERDRNGQYPPLVALPGGRDNQRSSSSSATSKDSFVNSDQMRRNRSRQARRGQRILQGAIAASVLLALGVGGLITWTLWQRQTLLAGNQTTITPPAGLQQGPIPAGLRFLFLRNGALVSTPTANSTAIIRLTPQNTTVAAQWAVRPAQPGRSAGNMVAYIDLQQGFVHIIRSDGQNDTVLKQPLLKPGVQPSTVWNSTTGATILSSLAWSNDGTMLAFAADPAGTTQPGLYIYTISNNTVHTVALPTPGSVSHPVWSPDSIRIAFAMTRNGNSTVLDYNTQNQGVLTLQSGINTQTNVGDTILTLKWSPDITTPALTWSTGLIGHIHNIWIQRVGIGGNAKPTLLASGTYTQADYNPAGHTGIGSWLVVPDNAGVAGDITRIDISGLITRLTMGKQASTAQWSPDGNAIDYFATLAHGTGMLHVLNTITGTDTLLAPGVAATPTPIWSTNSQRLAYSTGTHTAIFDLNKPGAIQTLKPQGRAVSFSWSVTSASQIILTLADGQQGLYLIDTQKGSSLQLNKETIQGSIVWTQIP
ncbi:MAG: PD40 domain-containing protein [Ktedonobacteraceae bacterium]|nr:PD40 domain-containing protein [Ktedonobacteraceae bacterium]